MTRSITTTGEHLVEDVNKLFCECYEVHQLAEVDEHSCGCCQMNHEGL